MKKQLSALGLLAAAFNLQSQVVVDTVSVGPNYANQKFYSLQNDEQGTQSKDNWDLAFEINDFNASVLANTQKNNFAVYKAPYSIGNYATIDTTGIGSWALLYNSDSTWALGAFNRSANPNTFGDLGWGVYDLNSHFVNGDSCYVVKLSATAYKKLKLVSLIGGVYTFEYANINGSSPQTVTITKTNYPGKNFVYFDMTANTIIDREPASANWDIVFGRYTAFVPTPYAVAGIMANKGVVVAQVNNTPDPAGFNAWPGTYLSSNITTIGHDWKTVDISTSQWKIVNDTVYLVRDKAGNMWKVRPSGFGGAANGNFIFSKEKLSPTAIAGVKGNLLTEVLLYPNPASGNYATLVFSSGEQVNDLHVSVTDVTGKLLSSETITVESGLNRYELNTSALGSGVYILNLQAGAYVTTRKLIKQ